MVEMSTGETVAPATESASTLHRGNAEAMDDATPIRSTSWSDNVRDLMLPPGAPRYVPTRLVGKFSDELLALDLPGLPGDRRAIVSEFVIRRVGGLPAPMRLGVSLIAACVGATASLFGWRPVAGLAIRLPIPLTSEYVRLVRSLAYAYIWEHWPATTATGQPMPTPIDRDQPDV
jgi:hypothetical protein